MTEKIIYIIAGPNGSGKTTFARELLKNFDLPFVNADEIAFGLAGDQFARVRIKAGKQFLEKIDALIKAERSFIMETTLAGGYVEEIVENLKRKDYKIELVFIMVESVEEAINRIDIRVRKGGHSIPEADIRRRFSRSLANFWKTYRFIVDEWQIFLNSKDDFLDVAAGYRKEVEIIDERNYHLFLEGLK